MTCNCNNSNFGNPPEIDPIKNILNHKVDFDTLVNLGPYFSTFESLLTQYINAHYTFHWFNDTMVHTKLADMLIEKDTTAFIMDLYNSIVNALTFPDVQSISYHMNNIETGITDWGLQTDLHTAFENAYTAGINIPKKINALPGEVSEMMLSVNDARDLMMDIRVFSVNLETLRSEYLTFIAKN